MKPKSATQSPNKAPRALAKLDDPDQTEVSEPRAVLKRSLDWEQILSLPDDINEREILRKAIDEDLCSQFRNWLQDESQSGKDVQKLLDDFIAYEAQHIGVRMLLSDSVLQRVMQWVFGGENEVGVRGPRKDGMHYLERFVQGLVDSAKVRTGARAPIDATRAKPYRNVVQAELRTLKKQFTMSRAGMNGQPWAFIKKILTDNPATFPRLNQNLISLEGFCLSRPETLNAFIAVSRSMTPTIFFQLWYGWSSNRDPEKLRQAISSGD